MPTTSNVDDSSPPSPTCSSPGGLVVRPKALAVLTTYRCTAACDGCCFASNLGRTERLTVPDIVRFIKEGVRYASCQSVTFTGGECFLLGRGLEEVVRVATDLGVTTRCVTNGYWARRVEQGQKRLRALRDAGLKELNISTGDRHQRFVDEETIVNAVCLSVESGMDETVVAVEMHKERQVTAERLVQNPRLHELLTNGVGSFRIIESPWMPMDYQQPSRQDKSYLLTRDNVARRGGCETILNTMVLTPGRQIGLCCGLSREETRELNREWDGSGSTLDAIARDASRNFLLIWLYVDGPGRILAWAARINPSIEWENRYAHHCQACLAVFHNPLVRDAIRKHYRERVDDVLIRFAMKAKASMPDPFSWRGV